MNTQSATRKPRLKTAARPAAFWLWLSIAAAVLAIAGSVIALVDSRIYASLTPAFLPQAIAQDITNLAVASPALLILAGLALRGSLRAFLLWLGVVTFTVYNYVIYTFSVPFGPLFLLWVAVLGLCLYALIGGTASADTLFIQASYQNRRAVTIAAWVLMIAAALFCLLWLSEDVPALLAGKTPQSLIDIAIPTNPVHILDLGFFLPAAILTGVWLLKKKPLAFTVAPALIVFMLLTGIPILVTPAVQAVRGQAAGWGVFGPIGTFTVLLTVLLVWFISTIQAPTNG